MTATDDEACSMGTSVASEPNPSVEVERLREALTLVRMSFGWQLMADETKALIDAALSKQEPGVPTPGAWIEWSGGDCPLPTPNVEVRYRNGEVHPRLTHWASGGWTHREGCGAFDIIAYRIVPTPGGEG